MKRSGTKKSRESTAFLYERISRDDNLEGDSYSVANQKKLLAKLSKTVKKQLKKKRKKRVSWVKRRKTLKQKNFKKK